MRERNDAERLQERAQRAGSDQHRVANQRPAPWVTSTLPIRSVTTCGATPFESQDVPRYRGPSGAKSPIRAIILRTNAPPGRSGVMH